MSKEQALEIAISQIEKNFGKGSIMKWGDFQKFEVKTIPSGALSLDEALGVGGYPIGRVVEIFGPESSGKTTLSLHLIAEAQKLGGTCAFIDAEHAFDPNYAKRIGINVESLLISQPDYGEQALEICETLVRSGAIDVVVIDSVAALIPKVELEGSMGDQHVGLQARLMSQGLRKLTAVTSKSSSIVIFINQLREKIGIMFGNPETTPGGRALKFYSSIRLDVRKSDILKVGEEIVGNRVKVKVVKNKVAPPFKTAEFDIMYGVGISVEGDLIDLAVKHKLIEKSGAWYSYENQRLGQGKENVREFLKQNQEMMLKLKEKLKKEMGLVPATNKDLPSNAKAVEESKK
ncbi:MAG: recombinase RecA [Candidatus Margulisiibacteriota bacterium]|nr:MAG: recombinase RecA [Candidatus Margulisbacteria bacterium GWD2_39_127]OGI02113.1 MAG: recombinase RecA [Candidatus Margulisbacteria bacterium GWF2_38_17]OGI10490.1 MAG: recombinase RecA [Candidatus Margulisbacteria bacterium GWE2_39_32]PZM79964.1 MAG: recombinase RecA [Candidatus Margulisiibacteriota bacterium]HAR62430.1 recombinase RecA [Candidatus Margulisiibacteriota bacterium]